MVLSQPKRILGPRKPYHLGWLVGCFLKTSGVIFGDCIFSKVVDQVVGPEFSTKGMCGTPKSFDGLVVPQKLRAVLIDPLRSSGRVSIIYAG